MQQTGSVPDYAFLDQMEAAGPFHAAECFQCRKCTSGCPTTFAMDLYPDQIIRYALLGLKDEILRSRTIWVCASCETCTTRCPNGIHIAEVMDYLKELAVREGIPSPMPQILALHKTFLDNVRQGGRVFEGSLLPVYFLRSGQLRDKIRKGTWLDDAKMGWRLLRKKRFALTPKPIQAREEVRSILRPSRKGGISS